MLSILVDKISFKYNYLCDIVSRLTGLLIRLIGGAERRSHVIDGPFYVEKRQQVILTA
jgi:hypothetical protein